MRLLHTSDWHLGQTLYDFDRTYEHQQFLDWLLAALDAEQPDALLIAGDIFDSPNPSAESQRQLNRFLTAARATVPRLSIVLIAGNHDSAGRLEATAPYLEMLDASVVGYIHRDEDRIIDVERLVVPIHNQSGGVSAWCLTLPFLRPSDVPLVEAEGDPYLAGVAALYQQAVDVALSRKQPGQALIAMGHCHMVGGAISEMSERHMVIGGAEALSSAIFDPAIDYVALGHLHLAQRVGSQDHHRYSGSVLPLSFAETHYPHQVLLVEITDQAPATITPLLIPRAVPLLRVPATPAPTEEVLAALAALDLPDWLDRPLHEHPYLEVRIRLAAPDPGLRAKIEAALEGKPVRLAHIEHSAWRAEGEASVESCVSMTDIERLSPSHVFANLCDHRLGTDLATPEDIAMRSALMAAFNELEQDPVEDAV